MGMGKGTDTLTWLYDIQFNICAHTIIHLHIIGLEASFLIQAKSKFIQLTMKDQRCHVIIIPSFVIAIIEDWQKELFIATNENENLVPKRICVNYIPHKLISDLWVPPPCSTTPLPEFRILSDTNIYFNRMPMPIQQ